MNRLLSGYTILITRPARQARALAQLIEKDGGIPINLPLIKTVALKEEWKKQVSQIPALSYDWIVFTSANAVRFFKKALEESGTSFNHQSRIAVVGRKTANVVVDMGWKVDLLPNRFYAEELAELLKKSVKRGEKVLFPKSARARGVIPEALKDRGTHVIEMPLYTSLPAVENQQELKRRVKKGQLDFLTFTSPSTVKTFAAFLEKEQEEWQKIPVVSIGAITNDEAKRQGFLYREIADPYTIEGIVNGLHRLIKRRKNNV